MTATHDKPRRPHSKTRQNLRERLMREQVDHKIEERRKTAPKEAEPTPK